MNLTVSVAPHDAGFRASTGGPLNLTADGPTADAAVDALHRLVQQGLTAGELPPGERRVIHVTDVRGIIEAATRLSKNPQFDSYLESLAEYRRIHNAVPDDE
jgi:hypothetical protein